MRQIFGWFICAACAALQIHPVQGQQAEWKAIACTVEAPVFMRGMVLTIYYAEGGLVHYNGSQYSATVSSAEINFCLKGDEKGRTCFRISRLSGRFSALLTTEQMIGSCVSGAQKF